MTQKMPFACASWLVYFIDIRSNCDDRSAQLQPARSCHLNLTHCGDTKSTMRRDVSRDENVI